MKRGHQRSPFYFFLSRLPRTSPRCSESSFPMAVRASSCSVAETATRRCVTPRACMRACINAHASILSEIPCQWLFHAKLLQAEAPKPGSRIEQYVGVAIKVGESVCDLRIAATCNCTISSPGNAGQLHGQWGGDPSRPAAQRRPENRCGAGLSVLFSSISSSLCGCGPLTCCRRWR